MTTLRLALASAVLVACARGSATEPEPWRMEEQPTTMEPDAGTPPPPPALDTGSPGVIPRDTPDAAPDAGSVLDAAAVDAGVDAATADVGAAAPVDAGTPVGTLSVRTVQVGTVTRRYLLYLPGGLDAGQPLPLISVHHPFAKNGQYMADLTRFRAIADRERVVITFPDGVGNSPWYVGERVCNWGAVGSAPATQDDVGFVRAMVLDAASVQAVDTRRVFVAGLSMGGYFANHIGCQGRDVVRAVAAHSAGTYGGDCPGEPRPVMLIHGDADTLIPLQCGREALGYWATRNGCTTATTSEAVKQGECAWNTGCPAGREVGLCVMKGMDHGWAGAPVAGTWLDFQYGGGTPYEDAAEMMWKFFAKYR